MIVRLSAVVASTLICLQAAGIGFAGEWADPTGLLNLRARAYDPSASRFAARDTFGGVASAPQTGNRYSYALNNPYRYTDPSGRFVQAVMDNPGLVASVALQAIPIIGDAYSGLTGIFGYDPLAGITLSDVERNLAFAALLPFVPGGIATAARAGIRAAGAGLDALRGIARPAIDAFAGVARVPGRVAGWAGDAIARARTVERTSSIRYGALDSLSRPTGVTARLTPDVARGSAAARSIRPPGFGGGSVGHSRAHLLGNQLGGSGTDPRNLVAMYQNPANTPVMLRFENQVRAALDAGQTVIYSALPVYRGSELMPIGVTLRAQGSGGLDFFVTVVNRGR